MKVIVQNQGEVSLTQKDFLTQGGQGNIYVKNMLVYKIYHDKHKMIPVSKLRELSELSSQNIIKPERIITNLQNILSNLVGLKQNV